jgi:hypothetical protein
MVLRGRVTTSEQRERERERERERLARPETKKRHTKIQKGGRIHLKRGVILVVW